MKKELIRKIMIVSLIAVTLTACGKEQDTSAPIEAESETIPEEVPQDIPQETPEETPQEAPEETAEEIPTETPANKSEDFGESASQTEISGVIENVSEGSFVLSETIEVENTGNSLVSDVMVQPGNAEDKILTTVNYNDQTEITIKTSTDGITSTEAPGSISDLVKDSQLTIDGGWNKDVFEASKIEIFILDV